MSTVQSSGMSDRWSRLGAQCGKGDVTSLYHIIDALYSMPPRPYHNLAHINACLVLLDEYRNLTANAPSVELALWLHDCVYDPTRSDNEARSAAISRVFSREFGLDESAAAWVEFLIMATAHKAVSLTGDEALIADIDMAILGSAPAEYSRYAAAIRQEYSFVSEADYRNGRANFLRKLLTRGTLYHTVAFREQFGAAAEANLQAEIESLTTPA